MAKTRVSEIMKTYGVEKSEVASFLKENGVEIKTASNSVDEEMMKLVDAHFGGRKVAPAKESTSAEAAKAAEEKVAVKKTEETAQTENTAAQGEEKAAKAAPVKKKKIIIVTGGNAGGNKTQRSAGSYSAGGSANGGRTQNGGNGQRSARNGQNSRPSQGNGATYRPIKPKTAPSQMTVDYHKPVQNTNPAPKAPAAESAPKAQPEEKLTQAVMPAAETAAAPVTENAAPAAKAAAAPAAAPEKTTEPAAAVQNVEKTAEKPAEKAEAPAATPTEEKPAAKSDGPIGFVRLAHYDNYGQTQTTGRGQGGRSGGSNGNYRGRSQNGGQGTGYGQNSGQNRRPAGTGDRNSNRSYGQNGSQYGQGGQGDRGRGQGRPGFGASRPGQGASFGRQGQGGRPGAGGGRGFGGSNAAPAQEFGGSGNKRRNPNGVSRDRHNKKDVAFEQNEQRERRNRSGRFIKPVVEKVEEPEEQIKVITIPEKLTIGDLAEAMHLKAAELIKKLFLAGKAMTVNSEVTYEEAENIASDYDILCEKEEKVDVIEELLKEDEDLEENMVSRAPVVCVMGHVDHGKTSILDYIRHSRVTEKEAGGITQAIGAYTVNVQDRAITFLDTPGHEAFTAMRLRGAQSTDIAVLVVAADDGVMPQTVEAINHAKAAGVEIIVAVNKMDKPDANPDRVKEQLSKYELIPADWGGQTEFVNVSAKTGDGIDDLLETILLQADVMELKANPDRLARGLVLEAKLDRGRGPVANVLVQKGTLHVGDFISAGPAYGKVRAMINDKGKNVKTAGPSEPVVVLGLSDVPGAGEVIVAHASNDVAKSYAETYKAQHKEELLEENVMSMNVEDLFDQMREGKMKELELIVKADVQGSVEALCASLQKLTNDEVKVRIIHSAAGNINESDVDLAAASNAAIIGFNVQPSSTAKSIAEHNGVSIHLYKVIYQAIDDVNAALNGMLAPVYEEKVIGHAEVRQLFKSGKIGNIAGSMVLDGQIEKGCTVRITRDGEKIFEGALASLKRFKDDVKEVKAGYDCGLVFEDFDAMNVGDQIEAYKMVEVPREEVIARKEKEAARKAKENA